MNIVGDYVAEGSEDDAVAMDITVSGTAGGVVELTKGYTGTGRVAIWNADRSATISQVNVTDCPIRIWVQGTTESSAIPDVTVTATLKVGGQTKDTDSDTVTVVKVDKVQYQSGANWVDVPGTLYVMQGTTVTFKAIPKPAAASWPSSKPVWGGTAGATGTGTTKDVTFNTLSSNLTDFKTVTAECGNTVTVNVIVYNLDVTHIKFDHAAGHAADGIDIQENALTPITVPEWVKGGQNKPAAYTKSTNVTIKARFTVSPSAITSAKVRATTADAILGNLGEQTITFASGVSTPEYVSFTPANATPGAVGKGTVTWQWRAKHIQGSTSDEADINSSGPHTIYTVLATPTAPMAEPWTEVLDKSCAWANGQTTATGGAAGGAAGKVTDAIYGSGFKYETSGGASRYGTWVLFHLTKCLSELGTAQEVNCLDCASMVATFSNALGCDLSRSELSCSCTAQDNRFLLNYYDPIGVTLDWTNDPFTANCRQKFGWHAIAWSNVYDATLQVDNDGTPEAKPCTGQQPKNMGLNNYLNKLVDSNDVPHINRVDKGRPAVY